MRIAILIISLIQFTLFSAAAYIGKGNSFKDSKYFHNDSISTNTTTTTSTLGEKPASAAISQTGNFSWPPTETNGSINLTNSTYNISNSENDKNKAHSKGFSSWLPLIGAGFGWLAGSIASGSSGESGYGGSSGGYRGGYGSSDSGYSSSGSSGFGCGGHRHKRDHQRRKKSNQTRSARR